MDGLKNTTGGKLISELYEEMRDIERVQHQDFKFSVTMPHEQVAMLNVLSAFFAKTRTFIVGEVMERVMLEMVFSMPEPDRFEIFKSAHEESLKLSGSSSDFSKWSLYIEHYNQEADKDANS